MKRRTEKKRAARYLENQRRIRRRANGHHLRHWVMAVVTAKLERALVSISWRSTRYASRVEVGAAIDGAAP